MRCELRAEKQLSIEHEIKHNTNRLQLYKRFAVEQRVNTIEIIRMKAMWSVLWNTVLVLEYEPEICQ